MANQTRDFPTENDLDILKLKTQLYAKVDQALDEVINRVNEHKSVTTPNNPTPLTELPHKSVKDILKDPEPIKPPTFDPYAVAKATELMKEAEEKQIPDPFAGLTERMNIDKVSSEDVDKASEELLKAVAFEKRMAKHDGKKDKPDPLQEAATELSKAILNYTNAVKACLVNELTTAFKHNSVNTRPNRDQLYGPGPVVKSTKDRALNLVASNILSDKGASKELLKLIQEAYADQSKPIPELKEDDSHLTKATPSEISRFNQKHKLMAIAQEKLREAKSMVEAVNELYPEQE